ncbi:major facilitator superfamily transporter [Podospora appendiculata]|uniref:Major facilitator superfamily transporter n=1 Tax=Podospora appendiculata TaxID=314037 RepID=A0AAE0XC26_9PEZI|nr:major facilitator superfamily transporter [Podospora appendiculata]
MANPGAEKDGHFSKDVETSTTEEEHPEEERHGRGTLFSQSPAKRPGSMHSQANSTHSTSTDDSDPLEPLEQAFSSPSQVGANQHATEGSLSHSHTRTSIGSAASRPPDFEVVFSPDDPENPRNWPFWYRSWITFVVSFSTWVVILYSTSYVSSIPGLMVEFDIDNSTVVTLGVTTYLFGLAAGSLIVAPMSELYGRNAVYLACMAAFTLLVIPCALATSLAEIIVVRFFGAMFGAAMISNSPGTVVDIAHPEYLALCLSLWSIAPLNGPVTGPVIGGFVYQYLGWRWEAWLALILAGASLVILVTVKETYAPVLLQRKAARLRKEMDDGRYWSRYDDKTSTVELIKINLTRPFVLALTEPILWFFNVWISIIYGILYLCFVAYPIVFVENRGWSPGLSGLSFAGIGIGTLIAIGLEPLWRHIINSHEKDPVTGRAPLEATAAVMIIGAILTPIGQLVFSWTCLPVSIHWAIPIAFGIPFGMGNTMCFIYSQNYLAGSYGRYAASALAGNAVMRSAFGGVLPLAGPAMYRAMTPQWAGTFLGLLEVCLVPIPFVFYKYGERIRAKSRVIRLMREEQEKDDGRRARQADRVARREEKGGVVDGGLLGGGGGGEV